jgi:hypothetical protein
MEENFIDYSGEKGLAVDGLPGDGAECFLGHSEIDLLHRRCRYASTDGLGRVATSWSSGRPLSFKHCNWYAIQGYWI